MRRKRRHHSLLSTAGFAMAGFALGAIAVLASGCGSSADDDLMRVGNRHSTSAQLHSFDSCDDLHGALKTALAEEMRITLLRSADSYYGRGGIAENAPNSAVDTAAGASDDGGRQEGVDFSGTNNQETGVDEADFVKTDGYHIYMINGNRLEIFGVPNFGDLLAESSTQLEGMPVQMLLSDNHIAIFSNISPWTVPDGHPLFELIGRDSAEGWYYRSSNLTKLTVIDISDRQAPSISRELYLEGSYQTARRVNSSVRMLAYSWMDIPGLQYWPQLPDHYWQLDYQDPQREEIFEDAIIDSIRHNNEVIRNTVLADYIPQIFERLGANTFTEHPFTTDRCQSFSIADDSISRGLTSILSLDLFSATFAFDADHIISNWSTAYASLDTLVIAEPSNDWWWYWGWQDTTSLQETSNIHRFDISVPGQTSYTGSGRVVGRVADQFSLSEFEDNIRVASTTNQWWWWWNDTRPDMENHVSVLAGDSSLDVIGAVHGIAVGESIWSARFVEDKAFLVTFRNIDPLWTIDMSEPTAPRVVGELEVPGVSTYIHPIADERLLTIGYGGDENGLDWNVQISLFDVSDFSAPAIADNLRFDQPSSSNGWSGSWSEAMNEHKAFQYWAPKKLLAIPLSTYRYSNSSYEYRSRLQLVHVDPLVGLTAYGSIDHSHFFNTAGDHYWSWRDVRRSIFMGDYVYAISDRGITAHRVDDLTVSASYQLPGSGDTPYWWW